MRTTYTASMYATERDQVAAQLLLLMHGFVLADLDAWLQAEDLPEAVRQHYGQAREALVQAAIDGNTAAAAAGVAHLHLVLNTDRRDCSAAEERVQHLQTMHDGSKVRRKQQAEVNAHLVAEKFKRAFRAGMGRHALQAAAMALIADDRAKSVERLATAREMGNKQLVQDHLRDQTSLDKQARLCTLHRAGKWLQEHHNSG